MYRFLSTFEKVEIVCSFFLIHFMTSKHILLNLYYGVRMSVVDWLDQGYVCFPTIINNISLISWWLVLLVEETSWRKPPTCLKLLTNWLSKPCHCRCKNYHMIVVTVAQWYWSDPLCFTWTSKTCLLHFNTVSVCENIMWIKSGK